MKSKAEEFFEKRIKERTDVIRKLKERIRKKKEAVKKHQWDLTDMSVELAKLEHFQDSDRKKLAGAQKKRLKRRK